MITALTGLLVILGLPIGLFLAVGLGDLDGRDE